MKYDDQLKILVNSVLKLKGIKDQKILDAFMTTPRHEFVPENLRIYSYKDHPLSIGDGQTISQPYIVALMVQLLEIQKTDKILEIGTGSGYQTAILSKLADEVFTVERIDNLARNARKVLKKLQITNVHFRVGDGTKGWIKAFPVCEFFDKIIISAASPEVPESLINQLKDGGILILPCGSRIQQDLIIVRKDGENNTKENHGACSFVPLIGEEGWEN